MATPPIEKPRQRTCAVMPHHYFLADTDPVYRENRRAIEAGTRTARLATRTSVIRIPVVVHVLYHTDQENIELSQIESQIAVWQAQIRDHQERLAQAGAEARANYENAVASMRENVEQANRLLAQSREAQEGAWKDMQAASQSALEQLQKGWADALRRFG